VPQLLNTLDGESFRHTLAVKVQGARNLLTAINPEKLRLLVTFGSIVARTGLPGEADYGVANEWLAHLTEDWSAAHPHCRCLTVEWSVWSGRGMGERLGRTRLMQQGVTPISTELGVEMLRNLLVQPLPIISVVVMSRFHDFPTFRIERPELPFLRFLEQPTTYYPGIELITDVDLGMESDPYLNDHRFQGENLLPAVMGLEAMAQVALALVGAGEPPVFEDVRFNYPVIVPATKSLKVRILALKRPNYVEVALRSEATGFQVNHFQARCNFAKANGCDSLVVDESASSDSVVLEPGNDLYGNLLFHTGRFQRLRNYRLLKAKECIAEITAEPGSSWFSQYLPHGLVLGDPGRRDAAIHAIQACIPHATLLPTGVERLTIDRTSFTGPVMVHARERSARKDTFVYDVVITDCDGNVHEQWHGLELKAVSRRPSNDPWLPSLLGPFIERRAGELIPTAEIHVAFVEGEDGGREQRSALAFGAVLGHKSVILKRPDGKPEVADGRAVSAAHHAHLTLAVASPERNGCDLEEVIYRSPGVWRGLIGDEGMALAQLIQRTVNESGETSATRVWAVKECLKKAGAMMNAPLLLVSTSDDGWVTLSSGLFTIVTYRAQIRNYGNKLVVAVLASAGGVQMNVQHDHRVPGKVSHAGL
jgi:enediyne polyketide synthase